MAGGGMTLLPKQKPLRSTALRLSAGHIDSACVNCGAKHNRVVLAHRNIAGHFGMGMKGPDWWAALLCNTCHDYGDGRGKQDGLGYGDGSGNTDSAWWELQIFRTMNEWISRGLVKLPQ